MRVSDVMTENPACCTADGSVQQAAQMMIQCDCGEIPVVENSTTKRPIGVVTDRDICCRAVAQGMGPGTRVSECMTRPAVTITRDADINECRRIMQEKQIRRLPVVDAQGACVGIVSQADVATSLSEQEAGHLLNEISQPAGVHQAH